MIREDNGGVTADEDLGVPLGRDRRRRSATPASVWAARGLAAVLALWVLCFAGWALVVNDPLGGEPVVVAKAPAGAAGIEAGSRPAGGPAPAKAAQSGDAPPQTVTIIDGSTGKRQVVPLAGAAGASVPAADQKLLATSRHGMLPQIAPDGSRPSDIYARKLAPAQIKAGGPRVAIVIGGLGIGATATEAALTKLPPAMTLAFSPYGPTSEPLAARARSDGRELLLQLPMEPFDYPDNDPGPQTLLTSLGASQNVDRLHWLMSRFQGYAGVANFMGARFTTSEPAMAPVMREIAKRGLLYFDDASSARSLASQLAGAGGVPFARADVVLDSVPTPVAIDRALTRLEALARERGSAVGYATAIPASIDRIAVWAKAAEGRGIVLVPVSAIAARANPS